MNTTNTTEADALRILADGEVVQPGNVMQWAPGQKWALVEKRGPFAPLPVQTLRVRHGQPGMRFAELPAKPAGAARFAATAEAPTGARLVLIGCWQDLAAYYLGDDGAVWSWSACTHGWSNTGNAETFKARQTGKRPGCTVRGTFWGFALIGETPAEVAAATA